MDPKIKEVFETEYAKIPEFVQSFLEKNSLKDKLEKYFAEQNKSVEYNSFTAYINVMLGDADGDDDYEATFPLKDLPLLRKWFEAYSKKYPEDVNDEYFWLDNVGCCDGPSGRINWQVLKAIIYAEKPFSCDDRYEAPSRSCYEFSLEYDSIDLKDFDFEEEVSELESEEDFNEYIKYGCDGNGLFFGVMPYTLWWKQHDYQDDYLVPYKEQEPF